MRLARSIILLLLLAMPVAGAWAELAPEPQAAARIRAIQQLAVAAGLLEKVLSGDELKAAFHAENRRRRDMKARGEVFYGPVQFRREVWLEVWLDQLVKALEIRARATFSDLPAGPAREAAAREQVARRIQAAGEALLNPRLPGDAERGEDHVEHQGQYDHPDAGLAGAP